MLMMVAVAGIVMADADVDALKAALEKVTDPETQCRIGNCYAEGKVVAKDKAEAVRWYRKAAEQGHVVARHELGVLYFHGIGGVTNNYAEAVRLFRKGAESGYARSIHNLGTCYMEGLGVPQDRAEAFRLYRKAADMGVAKSLFNIGTCYDMGWGVEKNRAEAMKWYRKAADQGLPEGNDMLKLLESQQKK